MKRLIIILGIILCGAIGAGTAVFISNQNAARAESVAALRDSLLAMDYMDIEVDGCRVEFSRDISSNPNSPFYMYTRVIHLQSLDFSKMTEIEEINYQSNHFYKFFIPINKDHEYLYNQTIRFGVYVRRNYPEQYAHYTHPENYIHIYPRLEADFQEWITDLDKMNLWISYGDLGPATNVNRGVHISYSTIDKLLPFRDALLHHARTHNCTND